MVSPLLPKMTPNCPMAMPETARVSLSLEWERGRGLGSDHGLPQSFRGENLIARS